MLKRKGFTLIELLVVVIIVAILAGLALPQFLRAAERARAAEGASLLGMLRSAQFRYATEYGNGTSGCGNLDAVNSTAKYFDTWTCIANSTTTATNSLASLTRNTVSNSGFGSYVLTIFVNGTVTCSGGTTCPPGF